MRLRNVAMLLCIVGMIAGSLLDINSPGVYADGDPVLVGAGDISSCGLPGAELTARLLDKIPGVVFTAGDNAYPDGSAENYKDCYGPTWGRHKARTRPALGGHEYHDPKAQASFDYFGANLGPAGKGYYSYDLGAWHIVVLNSNALQGLQEEELKWLQADLSAHRRTCTLAIAHNPVFSSGLYGLNNRSRAFFQMLYQFGASVFISGEAHNYERFAPQNSRGQKEPTRGIRQFVVGTGGAVRTPFGPIWKNTEIRDNSTWGVLKLTLHPASYDWEFVPVAGGAFHDSGSAPCASVPPPTQAPTAASTATRAAL